jgi:hypothetical protein
METDPGRPNWAKKEINKIFQVLMNWTFYFEGWGATKGTLPYGTFWFLIKKTPPAKRRRKKTCGTKVNRTR